MLDKSSIQGFTSFCIELFCTFVFSHAEKAKSVRKEIASKEEKAPRVSVRDTKSKEKI